MNVILTGFMGTGKTAVGRRLAKRLGWRFVDVDRLIEQGAKRTIARIFSERGQAVFRRLERWHIHRVTQRRQQVIATGGGAFVDPVSRARLKASGTVICLTARPRTILQRVGRRIKERPMLHGATDPLARIKTLLTQRAQAYGQADLMVDTSDLSVETVMERLWQQLSSSVCTSWPYLLDHASELSRRYGGQYVVVKGERIVAAGRTQLEAYQHAAKRLTDQQGTGIYYIPHREESLSPR